MRSSLLLPSRLPGILMARRAPAIVHMSEYNANVLTALIPQIYDSMDVVSRELVGFIPSAMRAPSVERAAVGQSVAYPIAPVQAAVDIAPAMNIPEPPDNTITTGFMQINKARAVPFGFTGEEQRGLNTGGPGYLTAQGMLIAQALRTLCNEVEADGAAEAAANASRATGTPGTTPFAGSIDATADVRKILDDNGAPLSGRSLVINTTSGAAIRKLEKLTKANEAGSNMTLRQGELLDLHGFSIKETGQAVRHTKGTGASATTNAAGYAVGATVITLAAAGTGTIIGADFATFAGDTNVYNIVSGDADVSNGGTITIAEPGLRVAIPAAATAITLSNTYSANVAFSMDALHVAMRAPAKPEEGDLRVEELIVTDPRSGISFEFTIWPGYRKMRGEVGLAWGWKATKRAHIAMIFG